MFDDDIFEDEIDEEAAAELERKRAEEEARRNAAETYRRTSEQYHDQYNNYQRDPYAQRYEYSQPRPTTKQTGTGRAVASLILGIISLLLFCSCLNIITAIMAIIFGIDYLRHYDLSRGKAMAISGIVTAAVSIVMFFASWNFMTSNDNITNLMEDDYFEFYYNYDNGSNSYDPFEDFMEQYENNDDYDFRTDTDHTL